MSSQPKSDPPCFSPRRRLRLGLLLGWMAVYVLLLATYFIYTYVRSHDGIIFSLRYAAVGDGKGPDIYTSTYRLPLLAEVAGHLLYLAGPHDIWAYTPEGKKVWHHKSTQAWPGGQSWTYTAASAATGGGICVFGTVYFTNAYNVRFGSAQKEMQCVTCLSPTGELNWLTLSSDLPNQWQWVRKVDMLAADTGCYIAGQNANREGYLLALGPDGGYRYHYTYPQHSESSLASREGYLAHYMQLHGLVFYAPDGTKLWQRQFPNRLACAPVITPELDVFALCHAGQLYHIKHDGTWITPLDLNTLEPVAGEPDSVSDPLMLALGPDGNIHASNQSGQGFVLDYEGASIPGATAQLPVKGIHQPFRPYAAGQTPSVPTGRYVYNYDRDGLLICNNHSGTVYQNPYLDRPLITPDEQRNVVILAEHGLAMVSSLHYAFAVRLP